MPMFQVAWTDQRRFYGYVEADSESAAIQRWIDDELDAVHDFGPTDHVDVHVGPVEHDALCCCPACERAILDKVLEKGWDCT